MRITMSAPADACARVGHNLVAPVTSIDHWRGARTPTIGIVEYADFASEACRAAQPGVKMLLVANRQTVQLIFRHFPIECANRLALTAA